MKRWKNRFQMVAAPAGVLADADSFVVLGFGLVVGENGRYQPGASNQALAEWVVANNPLRLPTITQHGVYLAFKELEIKNPALDIDRWVICLPHDLDVHVDTHGVALQVWLIFNNTGLERPVLVAHPYQSERSRRIFANLPLNEIIMPEIQPTDIPFAPDSIQRWTRNLFWYSVFEFFLARPIGRLFGWL